MAKPKKSDFFQRISIRDTIFIYFTVSALVMFLLIGVSVYGRLTGQLSATMQKENQALINQVNLSLDAYLRTVMKLSDSLYYGVIKNVDLLRKGETVNSEITLLYDNNKDSVSNIALLSGDGELLLAVPAARLKNDMDVTGQEWFKDALEHPENLHFSMPHVQYIFDNGENQYRWVITLSRAVEITKGTSTAQGVLLIDMSYASLQYMLDNTPLGNQGYLYLMSGDGELIYHPQMQLIDAGLKEENTQAASAYGDGNYQETWQGKDRDVIVKTVGYTGWKIIGVSPEHGFTLNEVKTRLFLVFVVAFFLFLLAVINAYISSKITAPIQELEKSVNALEEGELDTQVYTGGSYEIQHLGRSIGGMARRIQALMNDIVAEHESKRKSAFDPLQSQINPHFLYNILGSIKTCQSLGKLDVADQMISDLTRFYRLTLHKSDELIPLRDELEIATLYLNMEKLCHNHNLDWQITLEDGIENFLICRFTLQPLLENCILHGISAGTPNILIRIAAAYGDDTVLLKIEDNGAGIPPEKLQELRQSLQDQTVNYEKHFGICNVNARISSAHYGSGRIQIESSLCQGTCVTIEFDQMEGVEDQ